MTTADYADILERIHKLDRVSQLKLLEDLETILRSTAGVPDERSITELQGLGKALWQGVDAQEHVDRERDSWTG